MDSKIVRTWMLALLALMSFLAGCGGSGGGGSSDDPDPVVTYSISGEVAGLVGELTLTLNENDSAVVNSNGSFSFFTQLQSGNEYHVTITGQPVGQVCEVTPSSGVVASADVTAIRVQCENKFFAVGGTVHGLNGQLAISLNGTESLSLSVDGTFQFTTPVAHLSSFTISIQSQPVGQLCQPASSSGQVFGQDVTTVSIECSSLVYDVGGTVSGLNGVLILELDAGTQLFVSTNGDFHFNALLHHAQQYNVVVRAQPLHQTCSVTSGSGTIDVASVNNVVIECDDVNATRVDGNVANLIGSMELRLNGSSSLTVNSSGQFQFSDLLYQGESYQVTVSRQPPTQDCTLVDASGVVADSAVSVTVNCVHVAKPVITRVWPDILLPGYEVKVSGNHLAQASIEFDGASISPTLRTENELRFTVPSRSRGHYSLELQNSLGVATKTLALGAALNQPNISAVSASGWQSCALLVTGQIRCWGGQIDPRRGDGLIIDESTSIVDGIANAVALDVGPGSACAVLSTGSVMCWGANYYQQLGNSDAGYYSDSPVPVYGINNAVAIAVGTGHACAALADGSVKCWGYDGYGSPGDHVVDGYEPLAISGVNNAVAVTAGYGHSCALLATGAIQCWGLNSWGELGIGSLQYYFTTPQLVSGINNAVSVDAKDLHTCALSASGQVSCWGNGSLGVIGDLSALFDDESRVPLAMPGVTDAVALSTGYSSTCVLIDTGDVKCWGHNYFGQIGGGDSVAFATATTVLAAEDAVAVSAGQFTNCALMQSNTIKCWGSNADNSLGTGEWANVNSGPTTFTEFANPVALTLNDNATCVQRDINTVECMNLSTIPSTYAALGNVGTSEVISGLGNIVALDGGRSDVCVVLDTGAVKCWQHGSSSVPAQVSGIGDAVAVSAGANHYCVVTSSAGVKCWGDNTYGQLGNASTTSSSSAVVALGATDVVAVSANASHTCALQGSGTVLCWGDNSSGQLGIEVIAGSPIPLTLPGIYTAVGLSTGTGGANHTCAVLADGYLKCWGSAGSGQLGEGGGYRDYSAIPLTPIGIDTAVAVSASFDGSCAVLADHNVKCWGSDQNGQLGDDEYLVGSRIPRFVLGIDSAESVVTGGNHNCALLQNGSVQCWGHGGFGEVGLPVFGSVPDKPVIY